MSERIVEAHDTPSRRKSVSALARQLSELSRPGYAASPHRSLPSTAPVLPRWNRFASLFRLGSSTDSLGISSAALRVVNSRFEGKGVA